MKNILKRKEHRDGIKKRETRQGWMDGCCHGDNLRILLINRHMSYNNIIVTADQNSLHDNKQGLCLFISRILRLYITMGTSIPIHPSLLVIATSLFKSKDFSFTWMMYPFANSNMYVQVSTNVEWYKPCRN